MATFGMQGKQPPVGAWSSGLCDCFDDAGGCCLTFFCPCVTFGRIATIVDQGHTSCWARATLYVLLSAATGMGCLCSCCYRSKLRKQYGLTEKPCTDCCVHWCCEPCALCQEYRELKARGFDMSLEDGERQRCCNSPVPDAYVPLGARLSATDNDGLDDAGIRACHF